MSYEDGTGKKYDFFKYYKSPNDKQGSFRLAHWDEVNKEYIMKIIKTRKFWWEGMNTEIS
nr:hypothetical protein [Mycoplasmopsis bovis]